MDTALIVFILVLVAAGPIMWLRPSKLQLKQIKLRQFAMSKGLKVELRAPPGVSSTRAESEDGEATSLSWVAYTYPRGGEAGAEIRKGAKPRQWGLFRSRYEHELNFYGVWRWQNDQGQPVSEHLGEMLDQLPEDVKAISVHPGGATAFWHEKGGESEIASITSMLTSIVLWESEQGY